MRFNMKIIQEFNTLCLVPHYLYSLAIKNADENAPTKRDLVNSEFLDGEQ